MALKPIYDLNSTTDVHEDHDILVYQGGQLKKLNSKDFLYSKDYIEKNITKHRDDIVAALSALHVEIPENASLWDCVNAMDAIDLFEIGRRRLVHNGTSTETKYDGGTTLANNPKYKNTGISQTAHYLDRVYRIGDLTTIIPMASPANRNPNTDFLYADWSTAAGLKRNDFIGGEHDTTGRWTKGIYPWNEMKKVQILENAENITPVFNYDLTVDNGGSYFTEVPLYFIKEEILTESGIDITDSWPIVPVEYQDQNIYEYVFVCRSMLPGYRPAEFFKSYEKNIVMTESETGEYIYLADLDCYYAPKVFNSGATRYTIVTDASVTDYVKFLDKKHYFACYEASSYTDTDSKIKLQSRPSIYGVTDVDSRVSTTLTNFRTYARNITRSYQIQDMRSHQDFFGVLMEIEFATTNSQFSVNGWVGASAKVKCGYTDTLYPCGFVEAVGGEYKLDDDETTYVLAEDDFTGTRYKPKYTCGGYDYRTGVANGTTTGVGGTSFPIKWNWIENPWGNTWKFIDGVKIRHDADDNGLLENSIYVCENSDLYTSNSDDYGATFKKLSYIAPSEFLNASGTRTNTNGHVWQLGRDPRYPWARLTSKIGADSTNGYGDYYYENTHTGTVNSTRVVICGGSWLDGDRAGLRFFRLQHGLSISSFDIGASFERKEK